MKGIRSRHKEFTNQLLINHLYISSHYICNCKQTLFGSLEALIPTSLTSMESSSSSSSLSCNPLPLCVQEDDVFQSFPHFFETSTVLDELEQFYKPFYPVLHPLISSPTVVTFSMDVPKEVGLAEKKLKFTKDSGVKYKKRLVLA